jgi:hypothetical protein
MSMMSDHVTAESVRHSHRIRHVLRVVSALSMGGLGAVRGCGTSVVVSCQCPADASRVVIDGARATGPCVAEELDAGCLTTQIGSGAGPLAPPEFDDLVVFA